jgi:carbonic anhydrase
MTGLSDEGELGVLSVLLKVNEDQEQNKVIDKLMYDLWDIKIDQCINTKFSVYELLKQIKNHCYYWYKGSLTSPPCTENVDRIILSNPALISP